MGRPALPRPTDGELQILAVLWANGPGTVRDVHRVMLESRKVHSNSVLKLLQIMIEKGLVLRDDTVRPQVYKAAVTRANAQGHLVKDLMDRVFGGSALELIMRAASAKKASAAEIREIRRRLGELEDER